MTIIMRSLLFTVLILLVAPNFAVAGDDASGNVPYSIDLALQFTTYALTRKDELWSESLVNRLHYTGQVIHFVRTSLPLQVSSRTLEGAVYQAVEKPDVFYVSNGDAVLRLGTRWVYNPGVGGFSMHSPKSRNFIVCLNFDGGVPFLSSSPVQKGTVTWKGHDDWDRLK